MHIRIATRAWNQCSPADTMDDALVGVGSPWIEIDGHRVEAAASARVGIDAEGFTDVEVRFIATVEIVYVDSDGNEIGSGRPTRFPLDVDHRTIIDSSELA